MTAIVRGGPVLPHAQAFCDFVAANVAVSAITDFGTRPDHQPTRDRAVDIYVPTTSADRGNAVCALALANVDRFGIRYVIFRQKIWHRNDRRWVPMADRGAPGPDSQDHYDHVHVSFEPTAPAQQEDTFMALTDLEQADLLGHTRNTNAAVGRLEVAVRDQTTGVVAKLDEVIRLLKAQAGG